MNIVELLKKIEKIENLEELKLTRKGASFYMSLSKSKKYFHFFKINFKNEESLPYTLTLDDLKSEEWYILEENK